MRNNISNVRLTIKRQLLSIFLIFSILLSFTKSEEAPLSYGGVSLSSPAIAASLKKRIEQFPQWTSKPSLKFAKGDLEYPEWMAGTWNVTSTLVEQIAPLAPDIVTPGFEANQSYIDRAIAFQVRFGKEYDSPPTGFLSAFKTFQPTVVADRAFNGKQIAKAYIGDDNVYRVKIDPEDPNQQITLLRGKRKLISKITGRASEILTGDRFIATEVTQQLFRSPERLYLNEVETTSSYELLDSGISAEQFTAIYLSPQDPDFFRAGDRPVALYRYHLELIKESLI